SPPSSPPAGCLVCSRGSPGASGAAAGPSVPARADDAQYHYHCKKEPCAMRQFLCTLALLAIALPTWAADAEPKPNTLTPKEIADGWLLLFDGETMFGWSDPEGDKWTIKD